MDLMYTGGWMAVSTGTILSRHPEFWNPLADFGILESASALIPLELTGLNNNQISDTAMLCSICISGGLLTSVYNRGRHERLHGPLAILAFVVSTAIYLITGAPMDIFVFVIFPWILAGGLLASRTYSPTIPTDHTSMLGFRSRKERDSQSCI